MARFNIRDLVIPTRTTAGFLAGMCIVLTLTWVSLADAAFVSRAFARNDIRYLWPIHLLGGVVSVISTVLFIPCLDLLANSIQCSTLAAYMPDYPDFSCNANGIVALRALSAITIALFVPFALVVSLINVETRPAKRELHVAHGGREIAVDTTVRALFVLAEAFVANTHPRTAAAIFLCGSAVNIGLRTAFLPYLRPTVNIIAVWLDACILWLAIGTFALLATHDDSRRLPVAYIFLCSAPLVATLACVLPALRHRAALNKAFRLLAALDAREVVVAAPAASARQLHHTSGGSLPLSARAAAVGAEPRPGAAAAHPRQNGLANVPTDLIAVGDERGDSDAVALFANEWEVELLARAVLHCRPVSLSGGGQAPSMTWWRRAAACVPVPAVFCVPAGVLVHSSQDVVSRWAVDRAETIYMEGLRAFPDSSVVLLHFSFFIQTFRSDVTRATSLLVAGSRCHPRLDLRFLVFSRSRVLEQERQGAELGGASMNMVGALAFKRTWREALAAHSTALNATLTLWRLVKGRGQDGSNNAPSATSNSAGATVVIGAPVAPLDGGGVADEGSNTDRLIRQLARVSDARKSAQASYDRLLRQFPNAPDVIKTYSSFLADVCNAPAAAMRVAAKAVALLEPDEEAGVGSPVASPAGSVHGSCAGGGGAAAARAAAITARSLEVGATAQGIVRFMRWRLQLCMLLLLGIIAGLFVASKLELDAYTRGADQTNRAGLRRKLTTDAMGYARDLELLASPGGDITGIDAVANKGLGFAKQYFDTVRLLVYGYGTLPDDLAAIFNTRSVAVHRFTAGVREPRFDTMQTLWEAQLGYISAATEVAQKPVVALTANALESDTSFRLLADNYVDMYLRMNSTAFEYEQHFLSVVHVYVAARSVLLSACFLLLVSLGLLVQRSLASVQAQAAQVEAANECVPRQVAAAMVARYSKAVSALDAIEMEVDAADNDDGSCVDLESLEAQSDGQGDAESHSDAIAVNGGGGASFEAVDPTVSSSHEATTPIVLAADNWQDAASGTNSSKLGCGDGRRISSDVLFDARNAANSSDAKHVQAVVPSNAGMVHDGEGAALRWSNFTDKPAQLSSPIDMTDAPLALSSGQGTQFNVPVLMPPKLLVLPGGVEDPLASASALVMTHLPRVPAGRRGSRGAISDETAPTRSDSRYLPSAHYASDACVIGGSAALSALPPSVVDTAVGQSRLRCGGSTPGSGWTRQGALDSDDAEASPVGSPTKATLLPKSSAQAGQVTQRTSIASCAPRPSLSSVGDATVAAAGDSVRCANGCRRGTTTRHLSPELSAVALRMLAAFAAVMLVQAMVFMYAFVDPSRSALRSLPSKINVAGRRRAQAHNVALLARELLINDGSLGLDVSSLTRLTRISVNEMYRCHHALRFGDASMNVVVNANDDAAQLALATTYVTAPASAGSAAGVFVRDSTANVTVRPFELLGLDAQMESYTLALNRLLARFEPWFGDASLAPSDGSGASIVAADPSMLPPWSPALSNVSGLNRSSLEADPLLAIILRMDRTTLGPQVQQSVFSYVESATDFTAIAVNVDIAVFVLNVVIIVVLQLAVVRPAFRRMEAEAARVSDFLLLVPTTVFDSVPKLKAFLFSAKNA